MVYSNGYVEGFVFFQRFSCLHDARLENPDLFTMGMGMVYDDRNGLLIFLLRCCRRKKGYRLKIAFPTLGCPDWSWGETVAAAKDLGYDGLELRAVERELYWATHAHRHSGFRRLGTPRLLNQIGFAPGWRFTQPRIHSRYTPYRAFWVGQPIVCMTWQN